MLRKLILTVSLLVALGGATGTTANASTKSSSWASWYGPGLYGNHLGCGGILTTSTWGVAHKWLPCGTQITICYSRCVRATVIDRGPYVAGRDFDLTYPVKTAIGMPSVGRVRWWRNT
jgi:rare lipoprotein A